MTLTIERCFVLLSLSFLVFLPTAYAQQVKWNSTKSIKVMKNRDSSSISIRYFPNKQVLKTCTEFGFIQFIKMWVVYERRATVLRPGQLEPKKAWRDWTLFYGGYTVDALTTDSGGERCSALYNATLSPKSVRMEDAPRISESPVLPPYDPSTNKSGWKKMRWIFQTYAVCAGGKKKGTYYEGVSWTWEIQAANVRPPGYGVIQIGNVNLPPPNHGFRQGVRRFNSALRKHFRCTSFWFP